MAPINLKKEFHGSFDSAIQKVTEALKEQGFGILTRIDLHEKFKEKLGKEVRPVTILGACNPALAYEAYMANSDVASLLPCNAVVREIEDQKISIELASPTFMMEMLGVSKLVKAGLDADRKLSEALKALH